MINLNFTLVLQIVTFAIILALLNKVLFKPMTAYLDRRAQEISSSHSEAEKAREEAEALREKHRQLIDEARVEGERIREEAERQARAEARRIVEEARQAVERSERASRELLQEEVRRAREKLVGEVGALALEVSKKILEREIDQRKHEEIIRDYLTRTLESKEN